MEIFTNIKNKIFIPAMLRWKYGIKEGTQISISDNGDSIILKPMNDKYLRKLQGSLKGSGALKMLVDEKRNQSQ